MVQVMLPDGDRKGPLAARCAAGAGAGAGAGFTVTVTVGGGVTVTIAAGADGGVDATGGADDDVDGDVAGVADGAWTEPADEAHPATVIAASATSHT
jgi:hypothetical protein